MTQVVSTDTTIVPPEQPQNRWPLLIAAVAGLLIGLLIGLLVGNHNSQNSPTAIVSPTATPIVSPTTTPLATSTPSTPATPTATATSAPTPAPTTKPTPTPAPVMPGVPVGGGSTLASSSGSGNGTVGPFQASANWSLSYSFLCAASNGTVTFQVVDSNGQNVAADPPLTVGGQTGSGNIHYAQGGRLSVKVLTSCQWKATAYQS